jgi:rSAM-associated Gly-rich repeat protein
MSQDRRTLSALAALLPAGTLGLSVTLAAADAKAVATVDPETKKPGSVAERLQTIRETVSGAIDEHKFLKVDPEQRLAWWGNGWHNGWHNGGWGNGWHNGGWGNGWHNGGWGNGGWGNGLLPFLFGSPWGNGWHNWGNGWHNW